MVFAGIDSGSYNTKVIILDGGHIIAEVVLPNRVDSADRVARQGLKMALARAGVPQSDLGYIVATGFSRSEVSAAGGFMPDSVTIARGIYQIYPSAHSILDLGAQKSLAIKCYGGIATKTVLSDKCAAGTGSHLEIVSDLLEVPLDKMGELSFSSTEAVEIVSTCAIFVESEIISLVHSGKKLQDILKEVYRSLALRLYSFLLRLGIEREVALTGGTAVDIGLRQSIEDHLGYRVLVPEQPQFVAALGAAIFAEEKGKQ